MKRAKLIVMLPIILVFLAGGTTKSFCENSQATMFSAKAIAEYMRLSAMTGAERAIEWLKTTNEEEYGTFPPIGLQEFLPNIIYNHLAQLLKLYLKAGKTQEAAQILDNIEKLPEKMAKRSEWIEELQTVLREAAEYFFREGNWDTAEKAARLTFKWKGYLSFFVEGESLSFDAFIGLCEERLGNIDSAIAHYFKAVMEILNLRIKQQYFSRIGEEAFEFELLMKAYEKKGLSDKIILFKPVFEMEQKSKEAQRKKLEEELKVAEELKKLEEVEEKARAELRKSLPRYFQKLDKILEDFAKRDTQTDTVYQQIAIRLSTMIEETALIIEQNNEIIGQNKEIIERLKAPSGE